MLDAPIVEPPLTEARIREIVREELMNKYFIIDSNGYPQKLSYKP
jgi:hypothetical protein